MLSLHIPEREMFDPVMQEFMKIGGCSINLEHSLVSASKWEAKYKRPFLSKEPMSIDETIDYISMMVADDKQPEFNFRYLHQDEFQQVINYIEDSQTATTFRDVENRQFNSRIITTEVIYYWMTVSNIPFEACEKWHLNRLLTLIRVCHAKAGGGKKMSKGEILRQQHELNEKRKAMYHTKG